MDINDIPAELRWEIAARSSSAMSFAQEMVYKEVFGKKYKEIEPLINAADLQLRIESGKEMSNLARNLGFPAGNAPEIDNTQSVISEILLGPELNYEVIKSSKNQVQTHISGCPMLNRANEIGINTEFLFEYCVTQNKSTVENLNSRYTQRFTKAMCMGDPYCEVCTELKK